MHCKQRRSPYSVEVNCSKQPFPAALSLSRVQSRRSSTTQLEPTDQPTAFTFSMLADQGAVSAQFLFLYLRPPYNGLWIYTWAEPGIHRVPLFFGSRACIRRTVLNRGTTVVSDYMRSGAARHVKLRDLLPRSSSMATPGHVTRGSSQGHPQTRSSTFWGVIDRCPLWLGQPPPPLPGLSHHFRDGESDLSNI